MNIGRETETIEFKKTTSELKQGIISISSILNKHRKGILYFGVKDNGDVCGQDIGKDTLRFLSRDMSGNIKPSFWYEINIRTSDDGKDFIEVQFSGENVPYSAYGRYYQRYADEDKLISNDELEKLFNLKKKNYSQWEESDSNLTIDDIDEYLLKESIKKGNEENRINYEYSNKKAVLNKLGLINLKTNFITNAGKILFSNVKPILIKLAVYATETKDTFLILRHFEGNIYECINASIEFVKQNINWNVEIDGNIKRKEVPEIPLKAIREIIVNAFCHGNYDANTSFQIEIFKDKVCIYSPGFFPIGYTPDDFAYNHEEPIMLNPKIINILFKTGEIESFGSGFERTFNICNEKSVEYKYENTKSGFKFIFYRKNKISELQLSKIEKQVLDIIKNNRFVTSEELAETLKKSTKTIYRAIKKLKDYGFIKREGSNFNGAWEII